MAQVSSPIQLVQALNPPQAGNSLSNEAVESAVRDLLATPGGQELLKAIAEASAATDVQTFAATAAPVVTVGATATGAFKHKETATGSIVSVLFWGKLTMDCNALNKHATGSGFGVSVPGGGFLAGDLYYNDVNDLQGKCWAFVGAAGPYCGVTYCHKQDLSTAFATWQAANIGVGVAGGSWMQVDFN